MEAPFIGNIDPSPGSDAKRVENMEEIGQLIERLSDGESEALDELIPLVYSQLRVVAHRLRRRESLASPTWNTTAVVNEAYLKLSRSNSRVCDRVHFFAVASTAMRQFLIDEARKRGRAKRGSGVPILPLSGREQTIDEQGTFLLALDEALDQMAASNPRLRRVVDCRYFGGMTEEETAQALGCSTRTVRRDWTLARARLAQLLETD